MFILTSTLIKEKDLRIEELQKQVAYLKTLVNAYVNPDLSKSQLEQDAMFNGATELPRSIKQKEQDEMIFAEEEAAQMLLGEVIEVN